MTYPTAANPGRGSFVQRRIAAMARRMNVRVFAPQAWPSRETFNASATAGAANEPSAVPPASRPRFMRFPGPLRYGDPWFLARAIRRDILAHPAERPDILDAHFEWPDGPAALRAAARLDLPVVVTLRGKLTSHARNSIQRPILRHMLRRADALIAVSRRLADDAANLAGVGRTLHVIPNGIDRDLFHPRDRDATRAELGLHPTARYIVSVGHWQALKGFDTLIRIWPRVRRVAGDVRLLLLGGEAGESDFERSLRAAIIDSKLEDAVQLLGRVSAATTARCLAASDLFVIASRAEGWCNAIHESLACGTPVVATDVGGNRELVRSDADGRLVPLDDHHALAQAVISALDQRWNRNAIAARGSARTWDDVAREVHAVFQSVLERRCIRPS